MTKTMREAKAAVDAAGLKFIEEEDRRKHARMVVENSTGDRMVLHISKGGNGNSNIDLSNMRANLKRFAAGRSHGLRLTCRGN